MNTRLVIFFLCVFCLEACTSNGRLVEASRAINSCGGTGYAVSVVTYGDSVISTPPVITLKPQAEFRVKLNPVRKDMPNSPPTRDLDVTIEGNVSKDVNSAWITQRTATYNTTTGGWMPALCVPPNQQTGDYQYKVTVQNIGVLDPRAHVN